MKLSVNVDEIATVRTRVATRTPSLLEAVRPCLGAGVPRIKSISAPSKALPSDACSVAPTA